MPPLKGSDLTKFKNVFFITGLLSGAEQVQNGKPPGGAVKQRL